MLISRFTRLALPAACILAGAFAPTALAGAPANVTVRVEGLSETKLAPTLLTTSTAPVVKDGNPADACTGTSALGALELATGGNWSGTWFGPEFGYSIESIEGESHVFDPEATANYFWSLWIDEHESEVGACGVELQPGDRVLLFPACFGSACPPAPSPLGVEAPATAAVGEPVSVTVSRYTAAGVRSSAAGASVSAQGAATATADSSGHATLTFSHAGAIMLHVDAPESVRTETSLCVHNGNDGTCGTTAPSPASPGGAPRPQEAPPYKGPFALVAHVGTLIEGHVYPRRRAPRLLSGTVSSHSPVTGVSLELRRRHGSHCSAYDGVSERFRPARCGSGSFFKAASAAGFSYLLPARLGPGRYVLDVRATDTAGNQLALARGTSRIVFYVR